MLFTVYPKVVHSKAFSYEPVRSRIPKVFRVRTCGAQHARLEGASIDRRDALRFVESGTALAVSSLLRA